MKYIFYKIALPVLFIASSCSKVDNYPAPDAAITGSIIDAVTNQPIETEQPNGIKMRLIEKGYAAPVNIDFWAKADGTYEHANIFSSDYKVIPIEGAFFPVDTAVVTVNGTAELDFTVTPYLNITAAFTPVAGGISANYKLSRTQVGDKISEASVLMSLIPTVTNTNRYKATTRNLSAINDNTILATEYTDVVTGLAPGTRYVRVAARTNNALKKYNYSSTVKVVVP